jgi:hypothetical protein
MPPDKRPPEDEALIAEEVSAKRVRHSVTDKSVGFPSLPTELQLQIIREIMDQPNRVHARNDLAELWKSGKTSIRPLIENLDVNERVHALGRNRGVESRLLAVCYDVQNGIPAKDAIRHNGPLSKEDNPTLLDIEFALFDIPRKPIENSAELVNLAEEFGALEGWQNTVPIIEMIALAMAEPPSICYDCGIDGMARLAKAYTRNKSVHFIHPLTLMAPVITEWNNAQSLTKADIQQIATLAEAFGKKEGAHYADRAAASSHHSETKIWEKLARIFGRKANAVIKTLALTVDTRSDELLPTASDEQLGIMKGVFHEHNEQSALTKIDAFLERRKLGARVQLDRNRSSSSVR